MLFLNVDNLLSVSITCGRHFHITSLAAQTLYVLKLTGLNVIITLLLMIITFRLCLTDLLFQNFFLWPDILPDANQQGSLVGLHPLTVSTNILEQWKGITSFTSALRRQYLVNQSHNWKLFILASKQNTTGAEFVRIVEICAILDILPSLMINLVYDVQCVNYTAVTVCCVVQQGLRVNPEEMSLKEDIVKATYLFEMQRHCMFTI